MGFQATTPSVHAIARTCTRRSSRFAKRTPVCGRTTFTHSGTAAGHNRNPQGYGVDADRGIVIFHRWGNDETGRLERFIIVLNFTGESRKVDVPFPENGIWEDLLNGTKVNVGGYWLQRRGH